MPAEPPGASIRSRRLRQLYAANAVALLLHQIDAAYWREWEMFRIPGGVQVFVLLNAPIVAGVLRGSGAVADGGAAGRRWSAALAGAGVFAAVFHAVHLARGHHAFRTPVSVGLLGATAALSIAQVRVLAKGGAEPMSMLQRGPETQRVRPGRPASA